MNVRGSLETEALTHVMTRVLIVDDNADLRILFRYFLTRHGLDCRSATGGEEALRLAESFPPDIVLLDIEMRGLDGYEVAQRLIAAGTRPWLVAMTGHVERARAAGFDRMLAKPFRLEELVAVVQAHSGRNGKAG